jgi:hypothetical protein
VADKPSEYIGPLRRIVHPRRIRALRLDGAEHAVHVTATVVVLQPFSRRRKNKWTIA